MTDYEPDSPGADRILEILEDPDLLRAVRREFIRGALRGLDVAEERGLGRFPDEYPDELPFDLFGPTCRVCGCTDEDCSGCYVRTGVPCSWVEPDLCSACA